MDSLLGLIAIIGSSVSLSYAALQDYKTREVTNWVWVGGLVLLPLTLLRINFAGLTVIYGLQLLTTFVVVLLGFRLGILGGADGKAILLLAITYPWISIDAIWLFLAPLGVLLGGLLIVGVHSLVLLILNAIQWHRGSIRAEEREPAKYVYWITRRLTRHQQDGSSEWITVSVPLVVYILMAYAALLVWMVVLVR